MVGIHSSLLVYAGCTMVVIHPPGICGVCLPGYITVHYRPSYRLHVSGPLCTLPGEGALGSSLRIVMAMMRIVPL